MSLLHLNISYLPYNIEELTTLLNDLKPNVKVIGITESRLNNKKEPMNSLNLPSDNMHLVKVVLFFTFLKNLTVKAEMTENIQG